MRPAHRWRTQPARDNGPRGHHSIQRPRMGGQDRGNTERPDPDQEYERTPEHEG